MSKIEDGFRPDRKTLFTTGGQWTRREVKLSLTSARANQFNGLSARLWLRGIALPQSQKYVEQVLLTEDARAEITRRAMEAEQTADRQEIEQ